MMSSVLTTVAIIRLSPEARSRYASIRRQSLHSKQLFEMRAHRQVETYTRRQRLLEPPLVDRNNLPAARKLVKCALHHFGEFGIAFAEHQRVIRVGQEITDDAEIGAGSRLRQHSVELHVVIRERVGLPRREYLKRFLMIAAEHELDRELLPLGELRNCRLMYGSAGEYDRLALQIAKIQDAAAAPYHELRAGDEHRRRERRDFAPLNVVRRRATLEIDLAGIDEIEPVLGRDRPILGSNVLAELRRDFFDDDFAKIERISDRLVVGTEECEGRRVLAVADAHGAAVVDLFERARIRNGERRIVSLCSRRLNGNHCEQCDECCDKRSHGRWRSKATIPPNGDVHRPGGCAVTPTHSWVPPRVGVAGAPSVAEDTY